MPLRSACRAHRSLSAVGPEKNLLHNCRTSRTRPRRRRTSVRSLRRHVSCAGCALCRRNCTDAPRRPRSWPPRGGSRSRGRPAGSPRACAGWLSKPGRPARFRASGIQTVYGRRSQAAPIRGRGMPCTAGRFRTTGTVWLSRRPSFQNLSSTPAMTVARGMGNP